jgi:hypothetical protein
VVGFTGSSIWYLLAMFPPVPESMIEAGYEDFARRWHPILDVFDEVGVRFALEVHPTEIAYDYWTTRRTLAAIGHRSAFGLNWDPSHMLWQGLDPAAFILDFADRIYHVDCKDAKVRTGDGRRGRLSSHLPWGDPRRGWDFVSTGHGNVPWEDCFRALNTIGYEGPISIEWEDAGMTGWPAPPRRSSSYGGSRSTRPAPPSTPRSPGSSADHEPRHMVAPDASPVPHDRRTGSGGQADRHRLIARWTCSGSGIAGDRLQSLGDPARPELARSRASHRVAAACIVRARPAKMKLPVIARLTYLVGKDSNPSSAAVTCRRSCRCRSNPRTARRCRRGRAGPARHRPSGCTAPTP